MEKLRKANPEKKSVTKRERKQYAGLSLVLCVVMILSLVTFAVPAEAASGNVEIRSWGQVVDSLNGVEAKYIPGTGNSNTGDYSCADYIKRYYKALYGVDVYNLLTGKTPQASGHNFSRVTSGVAVGDIIYHTNSSGSGHWAIAKEVNGNQISLIEQNWKFMSGGRTYASVNRVVTFGSTPNLTAYRMDGSSNQQTVNTREAEIMSYPAGRLLFDPVYYANCYEDLRNAYGYDEVALKEHWLAYGIKEGRTASPIFDPKYYMASNSDVAKAYGATNYEMGLIHFCAFGLAEGRQGSPIFSAKTYISLYSDLQRAYGDDYTSAAEHFLAYGIAEMRQGSNQFSLSIYSKNNPDIVRAFSNPKDRISHFCEYVYYGSEKHRVYI